MSKITGLSIDHIKQNRIEVSKEFARKKKFIGYSVIDDFINTCDAKNALSLCDIQNTIFVHTRQLIKKQNTFIRKIYRELEHYSIFITKTFGSIK